MDIKKSLSSIFKSDDEEDVPKNSLAEHLQGNNDNSLSVPWLDDDFVRKRASEKSKHKSSYPWLFGKSDKGVKWDSDPIYIRERIKEETIVQMAIENISREIANTDWEFKIPDDADIDDETIENARDVLTNPNPDEDLTDVLQQFLADSLTIGSACLVLSFNKNDYDGDTLNTEDPQLLEIKSHDPATFNKDYDKTGRLKGFYQFAKGRINSSRGTSEKIEPIHFDREEIVWFDINPRSFRAYGLSPSEMALPYIELTSLALNQEMRMFGSGMLAPGALVFEELDNKETQSLMEEINNNMRGKPEKKLVLGGDGGDVSYEDFSFNYSELQYAERQKWYAQILASVFQVPMSVIGLESEKINRATFESERQNYEAGTLEAYEKKLQRLINKQIIHPFFDEDLDFQFTPGQSENSRDQISSRVIEQFKAGVITRQEAREKLGKDKLDEGDVFYEDLDISEDEGGE